MRWSLGSLALALVTEGPCGAGSKPSVGPSALAWGGIFTREWELGKWKPSAW